MAALAVIASALVRLYAFHLVGLDGMYCLEAASALEAKYGGAAIVIIRDDSPGSGAILSPTESIVTYSARLNQDGGLKREGLCYVRINGLAHEYLGDDLQEGEITDALARQIAERAGIEGSAYRGYYGFVGRSDNREWKPAESGFVERFDGGDALAFLGDRAATIDVAYESGSAAIPDEADFGECPNIRIGLLGVNEQFDGNVRALRGSLSIESVADAANEMLHAGIDASRYEGVYEWSPDLARPDAVDDLAELVNGIWKVSHPSRNAYRFGGERFDRDFRKIEGLAFQGAVGSEGEGKAGDDARGGYEPLEVFCGPYEYVGSAKGEVSVVFGVDEAASWFERCEQPYLQWDYDGPGDDVWSFVDSPFPLSPPRENSESYIINISLADSFVVVNGRVERVKML